MVTSGQRFTWQETPWEWGEGYGEMRDPEFHVVAIDYGIKRNILRQLAGNRCKVTVVPAQTSAADILALKPDGIFLSNGPGDPAATGEYAVPVIRELIDKKPVFGICLGHQMLAIAIGGRTMKMHQGHHGANHPVKDLTTGKVEITSMNHGFAVDSASLPANRGGDACLAVRRLQLRPGAEGPAGVLGAVPPRGLAGPARQPRLVQALCRADAGVQAELKGGPTSYSGGRSGLGNFNPLRLAGDVSAAPAGSITELPMPIARKRRVQPITHVFADDGNIPNNVLPLVLYRGGIDLTGSPDPEELIEKTFTDNGWQRFVAQRHLPVCALSLDDPRGDGGGARPRQGAVRRRQWRGDRRDGRRRRGAAGRDRPSAAFPNS